MNKKINIAALASYRVYPPESGGQRCIALFYEYLAALLPVTMISVRNSSAPSGSPVKYAALLPDSKWRYVNPLLFFRIRKFLRRNEITHLVLEHPYYGWLGRSLKLFSGIRLVVHSHNIEGLRFRSTGRWWWRILWHYERWTHRGADINFFITPEDLNYAKKHFGLREQACYLATYGTETAHLPAANKKQAARKLIAAAHDIPEEDHWLLFNGFFNYLPNLAALDLILEKINPVLSAMNGFKYKIIICGKGLPAAYNNLNNYREKNIVYAGFVPDIRTYFIGADIFINPVTEGGGIKTKLVEALSYNLSSVTTESGATGIPALLTGNKMMIVKDGDIPGFCEAVISVNRDLNTPVSFFDHFYWGNIAAKVSAVLQSNYKTL